MVSENNRFSFRPKEGAAAYDCNGCAVCMLSCPVWRHTHDQAMTFCGRMRSLQGGARADEISEAVNACILCGSCEPVCSYGVESIGRTIDMRTQVNAGPLLALRDTDTESRWATGRVLLANPMLSADITLLDETLAYMGGGVKVFDDNGDDISGAMESGRPIDSRRIELFMNSLRSASEVITTDGLIYRIIRRFEPGINVKGIGEALMSIASIGKSLRSDDLYVIDSRTYHADFERLVAFYDALRKQSGAIMNLDLHRVATPTGATLHPRQRQLVDVHEQARWILKGRNAKRIVVEKLEDLEPFRAVTDIPVIFVAELV